MFDYQLFSYNKENIYQKEDIIKEYVYLDSKEEEEDRDEKVEDCLERGMAGMTLDAVVLLDAVAL